MKWKRTLVLGAAAACFACAAPPRSALADTLDQQQTTSNANFGIGSTRSIAQTFTAGISGNLDRVDLLLFHLDSPTESVGVQIQDASSAGPGSTVLASNSIPAASIGTTAAFVPVTFTPSAPVTAGTQYAIVAYSANPSSNYGWDANSVDVYPGGVSFGTTDSPPTASSSWSQNASYDQAFKTYVTPAVTPPSGATGQRAAALKKCKKRAHKHHWSHRHLRKCRKKANLLPV